MSLKDQRAGKGEVDGTGGMELSPEATADDGPPSSKGGEGGDTQEMTTACSSGSTREHRRRGEKALQEGARR